MGYRNGKDVLPPELLKKLQEYVDGELIYVPKQGRKRAGWGEINGTRSAIQRRNREISKLYRSGRTICQLACEYNLSEDSIRKIVSQSRKIKKVYE